MNIHE